MTEEQIKPKAIFEIEKEQLYIPDSYIRLAITNKEDFLKWVNGGGVYKTHKPDKKGFYHFYSMDLNPPITAIYKQTQEEL